jgi:hypothetical protein
MFEHIANNHIKKFTCKKPGKGERTPPVHDMMEDSDFGEDIFERSAYSTVLRLQRL